MIFKSLLPFLAITGLVNSSPLAIRQSEPWTTLPPTPNLPSPISTTKASINNVELWFQKYNEAAGGPPIVFIHGGLGYSAYFGDVISSVSKNHYVIAVDRRGHGRSTYGANDVFTFEMFAKDTYDLLKAHGVDESLWVGWSDGASTALAGLLDATIAPTITKAFIFAGSQTVSDSNATFSDTAIYKEFVTRCATEYAELQPTANFTDFGTKVATLEATLPTWTDADMGRIDGSKVTVAGAEYDEAVNLAAPAHMHSVIPGSKFVTLTNVSHFAPVQDPAQFSQKVEDFIAS